MALIKQNKLIPLLAITAAVILAIIIYKALSQDDAPSSAKRLTAMPSPQTPPQKKNAVTTADADTPAETLRTLTAEVKSLKEATQVVTDQNNQLRGQNAQLKADENTIVERVRNLLKDDLRNVQPNPSVPPTNTPASNGSVLESTIQNAAGQIQSALGSSNNIPAGLGYDDSKQGGQAVAASSVNAQSYITLTPIGMKQAQGADGKTGLVKTTVPQSTIEADQQSSDNTATVSSLSGSAQASKNKAEKESTVEPYFTIPENATLLDATTMTSLVGRIPVDGKVHDPMQFKLLIGRNNLAANGQFVPADIAGMVVSGIAVGDMTLGCSEGLIQSITFIFNDGTIQTVSRRKSGSMPSFANDGNNGNQSSITNAPKLGYLSDQHGNPCIAGKFVTNAPGYLTTTAGLKTLTLAARSAALAQTTTTANGLGVSTGITGDKNTFVLGEAAGGAVDEVSNWIMHRLNNSFDAIVTPAGMKVAVHMEQEIVLDKDTHARKLNYGHINGPGKSTSSHYQELHYGLD